MCRVPLFFVSTILLFACSEHRLKSSDAPVNGEDDPTDGVDSTVDLPDDAGACEMEPISPEELPESDACPIPPEGGFTPIVEWDYGLAEGCLSQPVVGDIDKDGVVEVVLNIIDPFGVIQGDPGDLVIINGDGSGQQLRVTNANLAYGSPLAIGDLTGDGTVEIIGVRQYENSQFFTSGDYVVAAWDVNGNELWESEHFINTDFSFASAPIIYDFEGDGDSEIVVGHVILNSDGSVRGVGEYGIGSYGIVNLGGVALVETAIPAVTDLDLDGEPEIIVGDAWYDADGNAKYVNPNADDGMISIANLDDDPEGEYIAITGNTIRAVDTNGSIMWGPITYPEPANILSPAAIADIDGDGYPEILSAGGNELRAYNHDGSMLWSADVVDESGATAASIFDFEGDGIPEVVYIDELNMYAFDGPTGGLKFFNAQHASQTMFDYPVVSDVDSDGQAEILVCHNGHSNAFSVYGDQDESWRPTRNVWNQHAYHINNVNDDLTIPTEPEPSFVHSNTYHSAIMTGADSFEVKNLEAEILDVCTDECEGEEGSLWMTVRVNNRGETVVPAGIEMSLFGLSDAGETYLATITVSEEIQPGWSSSSYSIGFFAADIESTSAIVLKVDNDGSGYGTVLECNENDNVIQSDEANCN